MSLSDIMPQPKLRTRNTSISDKDDASSNQQNKRSQHLSETSDCGSTDSSNGDFFTEEAEILHEMFPDTAYVEVKKNKLFSLCGEF